MVFKSAALRTREAQTKTKKEESREAVPIWKYHFFFKLCNIHATWFNVFICGEGIELKVSACTESRLGISSIPLYCTTTLFGFRKSSISQWLKPSMSLAETCCNWVCVKVLWFWEGIRWNKKKKKISRWETVSLYFHYLDNFYLPFESSVVILTSTS